MEGNCDVIIITVTIFITSQI